MRRQSDREKKIASDNGESTDVRLARAGSHEAFERLYRRHADRIFRLARWMLSTPDVEDVVQDVFVRAWTRLHTLRGAQSFGPWLRRLAANVVLRRRQRLARARSRAAPMEAALRSAATPGPERGIDLERGIVSLPPGARDVFVLHDVEGFSHVEIAALLGVAQATSRSQLSRARMLLREFLD